MTAGTTLSPNRISTVFFGSAASQRRNSPRDAFWSSSDLIKVTPTMRPTSSPIRIRTRSSQRANSRFSERCWEVGEPKRLWSRSASRAYRKASPSACVARFCCADSTIAHRGLFEQRISERGSYSPGRANFPSKLGELLVASNPRAEWVFM